MNLRDVKYLLAVADTRHFGKAAERCFISQPTLSGQIKKLEEELGVLLFERTNRSVIVTQIGEKILVHARLLLEQVNYIQQLAHTQHDPLIGTLRLGIIPTLSPYLLPLILMPMQQRYPQLRLVLVEETADGLYQRLHTHEIDAALLATPAIDSELVDTILFTEPFWIAYPPTHQLSNQEQVTQKDLEGLNILLLNDSHCLTQHIMKICPPVREQQYNNLTNLRASSLETLLQLVNAGFGCTLVPALALPRTKMPDINIGVRQLLIPDATRQIRLVYRTSYPHKSALQAFTSLMLEYLPNSVSINAQKLRSLFE